jgi:hypothetical protein
MVVFILAATAALALLLLLGAWRMGIHFYDESQVPKITVGAGLRPVISFTPGEAYQIMVYEGAEDGDGIGAIWSATGPGGYENNLKSPVTYGIPPEGYDGAGADPLVAGKTYTVTVYRKDPKGKGDSFLNTSRRYDGKLTFVAGPD